MFPDAGPSKAVAIVIGGTTITIGLVSSVGQLDSRSRLATQPRDGFATAMARIEQSVEALCEADSVDPHAIAGIGIGCTGPVDTSTGVVVTDYTLPTWKGHSVTRYLSEAFQVPSVIANNADTAVLGEAFVRDALDQTVVLLTLGTGVGGGVVINGVNYKGAQGEHPEIGHILVRGDGPKCYCGSVGCLEMVASGSAIGASGRRAGFACAVEVFEQARLGDAHAKRIVDRAVQCTSRGVWTLLHTFLPDILIFGGGVMEAHYDLFAPTILAVLARATMVPLHAVSLAQAQPGNDAGLIGAALLLRRHLRASVM
jgi:glucokinase